MASGKPVALNEDRDAYMRRRYRGSQSILNRREQRFVAELLRRVGPVARIADIPSGHGRFTPVLREAATGLLVCADHDADRLAALVEAEGSEGTPIETCLCDLYQPLPFPDRHFDLVFTFRFFHHIEEDGQRAHVVRELSRIAARYLIVSYYYDSPVHALQKRLWRSSGHKRRLPMISRRQFRELFAAQGCRLVEDLAVLPGIHAHRIALLERLPANMAEF